MTTGSAAPPPVSKARLRHEKGGGRCVHGLDGDRPRLHEHDRRLSRWTHRVGVTGRARRKFTPTRNAIGLSSPVGAWLAVAIGELSPWRSVLPPRGGGE